MAGAEREHVLSVLGLETTQSISGLLGDRPELGMEYGPMRR
jgi:hypothetical protein